MFNRYIDGLDKKVMKRKGFKYCKEVNKFVYDGYGVYLKDINKSKLDEYLIFFDELGYDMVTGPFVSGDYLRDVGLFCRNYIDVLCDREMLKDDTESLVKRIVLVSRLKDGTSDEYLEHIAIDEIKYLSDTVRGLDIDDFYKVVSDINNIVNTNNKTYRFTLKAMSAELSHYFYERVIVDLDKDVDKERVNDLISEAKGLAYDLRMTRMYPFLTVWNPDSIEETAKDIVGFVEKVKAENSTSEIRGLLKAIKISDTEYVEGTEYIVAMLDGYVKNKTLEEYSSYAKVKQKK